MSEKSNPETPRASDGHSGYSSTNESVLQSPNSAAIRKKKKPSLELSKSSMGRPVLVHSPCSMNRLNESSSVHSQSRDDLTTIETCSDPNTPHSSAASRSHSGGDFSAFQARMQQEKPRIEHWPLPSWPADDPMRLKLRALIIAKDYALGSGDQGTVFYATHKTTGKAYAVKELISHANSSRENLRSTFRRELVTLYRNVDTQHVVRVFDVYLSGDRMRLLMELMELGSLVDVLEAMRMKKVRPKSPGGCCSAEDFGYCKCPIQLQHAEPYGRLCITDLQYVAYGILHALHSIHSKNIIHRDLKPSNVLVGSTGIVKLCDFGVSRLLGDGVVATTTTGSQLYFAPERVTNVNGYGYKADVWSAGVLLAYCACGRYPIEGKLFDVLTQITSRDFKLQFPDEMPLCPLFVDFVSKCSTSNPEERPTAFEMLHHEFLFKNYEASAESSPLTQSSTRESFDPETNSSSRVCPASLIKPKFVEFIGENEKLEQLRVLTRGELRNVP